MTTTLPKPSALIGKGTFSKVYQMVGDCSQVVIHSTCFAKECMSLGWFPDHRLFPKLEAHGYLGDTDKKVVLP